MGIGKTSLDVQAARTLPTPGEVQEGLRAWEGTLPRGAWAMSGFDPYHKWLAIPPRDQPAHYYRLLGVELFEAEPDVLNAAADARIRHVRTFLTGQHAEAAQRILTELAEACRCLLDPVKKAEYDAALRSQMGQVFYPSASIPLLPQPFSTSLVCGSAGLGTNLFRQAPQNADRLWQRRKQASPLGGWLVLGGLSMAAVGLIVLLAAQLEQGETSRQASVTQSREQKSVGRSPGEGAIRETKKATLFAEKSRSESKPLEKMKVPPVGTQECSTPAPVSPPPSSSPASPSPAGKPSPLVQPPPPGFWADNELEGGDDFSPKRLGKFIMALCQDMEGNLWVGTEDTGVWRYNPRAEKGGRWTRFIRANMGGPPEPHGPTVFCRLPAHQGHSVGEGDPAKRPSASISCPVQDDFLGDDYTYALACDKLGRVWVGHLNHGVSVYNGQQWRNYDILTGPLGERVFDIAVCPADGDVWMATNAGLARYRVDSGQWSYYTRAEGLPDDQAQCLAFAGDGTLYVGTECHGVAISVPTRVQGQLEYHSWRLVREKEGASYFIPPCGEGLPSDLINDILVAQDGRVYMATIRGLAVSRDRGRSWQYVRGQNWEAKARGLYQPPPKQVIEAARNLAKGRTLLAEDYVTCLAEDEEGRLWVGYREKGYEVFDPATGQRLLSVPPPQRSKDSNKPIRDYITRFLPVAGGMMAATYGGGLFVCEPVPTAPAKGTPFPSRNPLPFKPGPSLVDSGRKDRPPPPLPLPAQAPTWTELETLLAEAFKTGGEDQKTNISGRPASGKSSEVSRTKPPLVVALPDDWRTQGDWLGRYGRYWACLCAICAPSDYIWGAGWEPIDYLARIGPHCTPDDSIRYWVHWLYTDNRRTLEMPPTYLDSRIVKGYTKGDKPRRQAEWDDHGESYPRTHQGPDLYCTLKLPEGLFFLSLYDFNKDGHTGNNRFRDYQVSIRAHPADAPMYDVMDFDQTPELARTRIHDFWGGVWKRFLVRGPGKLTIRLARNDSFNTILCGVMLDLVDETPPPYFGAMEEWRKRQASLEAQLASINPTSGVSLAAAGDWRAAVRAALDHLEALQRSRPVGWAVHGRRLYALLLRSIAAKAAEAPLAPSSLPKAEQTSSALSGLPKGQESLSGLPKEQESIAGLLGAPAELWGLCAYGCGLLVDWELSQQMRGLCTARQIEKSLRWDQKTWSFSGKGRHVVSEYLLKGNSGRTK